MRYSWSLLAALGIATVYAQPDVCQTYGGGYVYPQELRSATGHQIQWSKALSTFYL